MRGGEWLGRSPQSPGDLKIALRGGGGGGGDMDARRRRGGWGLEKWGSVSGPLFCLRTLAPKAQERKILARKFFSHQ